VQWGLHKEDIKPLLVQATQRNGAFNNLCIININYVYFQLPNCSLPHLSLLAYTTSFKVTNCTSSATCLSRNPLSFYVWIFVNVCTRSETETRTGRKFHICWMCERWGCRFLSFLKCWEFHNKHSSNTKCLKITDSPDFGTSKLPPWKEVSFSYSLNENTERL
jgi:hypothetical protein